MPLLGSISNAIFKSSQAPAMSFISCLEYALFKKAKRLFGFSLIASVKYSIASWWLSKSLVHNHLKVVLLIFLNPGHSYYLLQIFNMALKVKILRKIEEKLV